MQQFLEIVIAVLICITAGIVPIISTLTIIFAEERKEEKLGKWKGYGNGK